MGDCAALLLLLVTTDTLVPVGTIPAAELIAGELCELGESGEPGKSGESGELGEPDKSKGTHH